MGTIINKHRVNSVGPAPDTIVAADPLRELVKAGRIIDAVSLLRERENLNLVTARERVVQLQKEFGS